MEKLDWRVAENFVWKKALQRQQPLQLLPQTKMKQHLLSGQQLVENQMAAVLPLPEEKCGGEPWDGSRPELRSIACATPEERTYTNGTPCHKGTPPAGHDHSERSSNPAAVATLPVRDHPTRGILDPG